MPRQAAARGARLPNARPEAARRRLRVADPPAGSVRSIGDFGTLAAVGLFMLCLALAALHAVLVENQAELDDLNELNRLHHERIDQLQAKIADLDSPEGLARHAENIGLVAVPEIMALAPVSAGFLAPPGEDPFGLGALGVTVDAAAALAPPSESAHSESSGTGGATAPLPVAAGAPGAVSGR